MAQPSHIWDSSSGYGLVTRALHWGMAALFAWQFAGAILRVVAEDSAIARLFWSTHFTLGFTLGLLVLIRGVWGLLNLRKRPPVEGSLAVQRAARFGHLALYALMVAVPALAILRALGGTRGFTIYGLQLAGPGGVADPLLIAPGNALHAPLGWALLALVIGHVAMALRHAHVRKDPTLERMTRGGGDRAAV